MKKKVCTILVASMLLLSMATGCNGKSAGNTTSGNESSSAVSVASAADSSNDTSELKVLDKFGDLSAEDAAYAPNTDYDKYTLVNYYLEAADTDLLVTCSAKADESEYCMEFSFYGDDQMVVCDHDGNVSEDKTGFMTNDAPTILKYIQENAVWSAIPR